MFFQLIKKYPPASMNHGPISMSNILSVSPLYDGASDVQLIKPTVTYALEKTTVYVETTVLVECKGLTIFST